MADGMPKPLLLQRVLVVALPGDDLTIHLVPEVTRLGRPEELPDYRAPTTVCGRPDYVGTDKRANACDECRRGMSDAVKAATAACMMRLGIIDRIESRN
jgi:hypothetical protein